MTVKILRPIYETFKKLSKKGGFVARGCGAIMSNRAKKTKIIKHV